ncbi:hypothetical protein DFH06DRAFT_1075137 [Mycena polygramma]|nr:hypothetical protein DFH06DRAFT_1075137 [Mycena polygramma]
MPQSFRETVDVTSIIRSILDSYPLGNGILRELLQNSDDASATEQIFILDLRIHPSELLVDSELAHSQGPALVAVNNSVFETDDWKAIRTIHNSSKTQDETKTGKFGIGVRACYHVTDNPQFFSGSTLGIFDPHNRFSGEKAGGVQIDVVTERDAYRDQLVPFDSLLSSAGDFSGTVVRLPLRTPQQATQSNIKQTAVDPSEIRGLFHDFVEKDLSVVMLFLKHIRSISLKIIDHEGVETFVGSAEIPDHSISEKRAFFQSPPRTETFKCLVNVKLSLDEPPVTRLWRILHSVGSPEDTSHILASRLGHTVEVKLLAKDKLFSHVALAFPIEDSVSTFNGRLFTLLPLPIHTSFPLHMHAVLALTQDRQSLRNIEEVGTSSTSRERFLVTWNQSVFQEFLPAAWSHLLQTLIEEGEVKNIWSAWPSSGHVNDYWKNILPNLMDRVLTSAPQSPIFPTFPDAESYVNLTSALVASPDENEDLLVSLSGVGLPVVRPPHHLLDVLRSRSHLVTFLHPTSARNSLFSHVSALTQVSDRDKDRILEYLIATPGTISNAIGLPLVPLVDRRRISLSDPSHGKSYTLVTMQEEHVFTDCDPDLISFSSMSVRVLEAFRSLATVNVARLDKSKVQSYLKARFGHPDSWDAPFEHKVEWLARFWEWMCTSTWAGKSGLLKLIDQLHLLPTAQDTLRQMRSRIILPIDPNTTNGWISLGVHFLHSSVIPYSSAFRDAVVPAHDIMFLVDNISPHLVSSLDDDFARLIQNHVVQSLPMLPKSLKRDLAKRALFVQLPIFPTRVVALQQYGRQSSELRRGKASGHLVYIRGHDHCPVPLISDLTLFDVSGSEILMTVLDPDGRSSVLDEVGVLEIAIDHLDAQVSDNREALLARIIRRMPDLSSEAKVKLQSVPFVPVIGASEKVPPSQVIDPGSELASIYRGEPAKLPEESWSKQHLAMLTSQGFFLRKISPEIAVERIIYFSVGDRVKNDSLVFPKAKGFLMLLDRHWDSIGHATNIANHRSASWLPTRSKDTAKLSAPNESRDKNSSPYLFDLVLNVVDMKIRNEGLRQALGWAEIPTAVLLLQFREALACTEYRVARLSSLIKELTHRFSELSFADIDDLKSAVSARPWVPISQFGDAVVETKYALLQPSSRLKGRFRNVTQDLLDGNGRIFLRAMGCSDKPTLDTILEELKSLAKLRPEREIASQGVDLLTEIGGVLLHPTDEHPELLVPGTDYVFRPIEQVYFEDTRTDFQDTTRHPVHHSISPALARDLQISFLSSLELGDEDDDSDLQMGEDFTQRIRGVLKDYDVQYALNEFLANAVDAKATEFAVILDERVFESGKVLTAGLADLQQRPSLLLFNNGVFKAEDFRGLRTVGQGGKGLNPDSIGRYGLGALSLFHFTDVVQLISADCMLLLDPSGSYLPPLKGKPRTALKMRLSDVFRRYPDHLACFDSVHGFSVSDAYYEGTLFRLPLRKGGECTSSSISPTAHTVSSCQNLLNGPYRGLAKDAMYFTCLEKISASQRKPLGDSTSIWSVSASRSSKTVVEDPLHEFSILDLDNRKWLVTTSTTLPSLVPAEYHLVLAEMKLNSSQIGVVVRMAFPLEPDEMDSSQPYHLFSSLRLPIQSSLPAHIHAQFALSADRRHIRFEHPDVSGTRILQAAYNHYILSHLIPPLYISSISHVPNSILDKNPFAWWPTVGSDDISQTIVRAFYDVLPQSPVSMCYSFTSGRMISPNQARFCRIEIPTAVIDILRKLECPNLVYTRPKISDLLAASTAASHLQIVDPAFVKETVSHRRASLIAGFTNTDITAEDVHAVLLFLLEGEVSIRDLPLLVRADNTLVCASADGPVIYAPLTTLIPIVTGVFSSDRFIRVPIKARDLLFQQTDVNVKPFDATGVLALLKERIPTQSRCTHTDTNVALISNFWNVYERLPGPPRVDSLDSLPLVQTTNPGEYVSAAYARDHSNAISEPPAPEVDATLMSALQKLGVVFYRLPAPFPESYAKKLDRQTCIQAIPLRDDPFSQLLPAEIHHISQWIRDRVYFCGNSEKAIISRLPMWEALQNGTTVLLPWPQVKMLPVASLLLETFDGFLNPSVALAQYSLALDTVLQWSPSGRPLSSTQLARLLALPNDLTGANLERYSRLLQTFLSLQDGENWQLPVPNGNLALRPVNELYDHSQALFSDVLSLGRSEQELFLHPSIRNLAAQFISKGLKTVVDFNSFLQCARCIQTALNETGEGRRLPDSDLMRRARVVYNFYNTHLPSRLMATEEKWEQLSRIPFIPRRQARSTFPAFDRPTYCVPLPIVVSPAQLVRPRYEQVVWTQCGLPENEPESNLVAVNPSFGVPQAKDVVAHLAVLALKIAPDYPGDRTLLQHLQATYQWLDENSGDARQFLLCERGALFLNVDDPSSETWEWRTAEQLLFDTEYDWPERGTFRVNRFLQNYRRLLLAAGADTEHAVDYNPNTAPRAGDTLRDVFNSMRRAGQLTDMMLMPEEAMSMDADSTLRAHSAFLAATIPHMRDGLLGWAENSATSYSFPGTHFGACAVLDFVYTGKIDASPTKTDDGPTIFLRDLLELLVVADQWDMPELKDEIGRLIKHWRLLTRDTYSMILAEAEKCSAQSLSDYCQRWGEKNPAALVREVEG